LHFPPLSIERVSIPSFIYKIEQCFPLFIESVQLTLKRLFFC
jgi:hypothetical protein